MRWLLDQGLPRSAAALLREKGIDATHVGEISMAQSKDIEILKFALHKNQILVTLDADFHALLAISGAFHFFCPPCFCQPSETNLPIYPSSRSLPSPLSPQNVDRKKEDRKNGLRE